MFVTIIRVLIIYIVVIVSVRLMGKRQIGEMQPTELVITILLSEIAALPIQDTSQPILTSIVAVMLLVSFEIINSVISLKSVRYRYLMHGKSIIVVRNGNIDQKQLKLLRLTVDDLLESLREQSVFDIDEVEYAIVETNGKINVMLKPEKRTVTVQKLNLNVEDNGMPCVVVCDGRIINDNFSECNLTMDKFNSILKKQKSNLKEILLMTVDKSEQINIIKKENSEK
ncbi:MAG TPA: DUF421 domain-containing protein [Clostridia bacterium]|nr:DUF421 domain-containing protein [Clostridia bacterium]